MTKYDPVGGGWHNDLTAAGVCGTPGHNCAKIVRTA